MSKRLTSGSPDRYRLKFSQNRSVILPFSRSLVLAECGLTMTLGMFQRVESVGRGSSAKTSSPAPRRCPDSRASMSAASSRRAPRDTFTTTAPWASRASSAPPISPSVSGVWGAAKTRCSPPSMAVRRSSKP